MLLPSLPPLANNVLAKCRPTRVNSSKRRRGFGGNEVKPGFVFSGVLQVEKPRIQYLMCRPGSNGGGSGTVCVCVLEGVCRTNG